MSDSAKRKPTEPNAEVFTPAPVVDYMLDAVETDLGRRLSFRDRVLEPSAGDGAFVKPLVERILGSMPRGDWSSELLLRSLLAFETNPAHAATLRCVVSDRLRAAGCPSRRSAELVAAWIREEDFLLARIDEPFDAVVGNPPYVRYDAIEDGKTAEYERLYPTFRGRCDLYVPFVERSLSLLAPDGVFCFICSNRFAKNDYGRRLRACIAAGFRVALFLNLEHANVFGKDVAAYPAVLMIDRKIGKPTFAATVSSLAEIPLSSYRFERSARLDEFPEWYRGDDPWTTTNADAFQLARRIESGLPTLVDSAPGTRFGIGVATGNDKVFVRSEPEPGVESDCLLPLVTGDDVRAGVRWGGSHLVNPFRPDASGAVRDLSERPGLRHYLEKHKSALSSRFVAKHKEWYRTIDRVSWPLFKTPKILLPDIQRGGVVGLDRDGSLYPHHNLYWIASDGWPLELLAAILKSGFVTRQIRWASCEMRGGSIRYQAKNLERLRLPPRAAVTEEEERKLIAASSNADISTLNRIVDGIVERCLRDGCFAPSEEPEQLLLAMDPGVTNEPKKHVAEPERMIYQTPEGFDDLVLVSDGEAITGVFFEGSKGAMGVLAARPAGTPYQKTPRTPRTLRENQPPRALRTLRETFKPVSAWLDRYFSGRDPGPLPAWRTPGLTPFQLRVQQAMLAIPRGETRTYGDIAAEIARERGVPRVSAQAVGQAVGRNPLCILVPCHRVVGAGAKLVGYGGGLPNKAALLRLEGSRP